ncbi:Hypothetical protein PHPALM_20689 [Phytophthora palmivora]|uniref:Uncharacterized protein n=1 Tax=Phytophthora palmivora TaxID=4796 RepID=A0A2P4XE80_9STRA|nr:Hypothetical protein PHPALM_20689 [Phytophthora palmivora]
MESRRRPSEVSTSSDTCRVSDISFTRPDSPLQRPNDSFTESQQCSADPNAFLGFHVPPSAEEVDVGLMKHQEKKESTLKLVLDLDVATGDVTRGGDGFRPAAQEANPFSELFAGDTQDDENLMMLQAPVKQKSSEKVKMTPLKRQRESRSPSPPPTLLKSVETAWKARKEKVTSEEKSQVEDSIPASAYSELSEDLAPRIFQTLTKSMDEKRRLVEKDVEMIAVDSDRETDYEAEVECTQQLEDDELDFTSSYGVANASDEGETEVFPQSDTGTLPFGPDSTFMDEDENIEDANGEQKEVVNGTFDIVPTPDQKNNPRTNEDEC